MHSKLATPGNSAEGLYSSHSEDVISPTSTEEEIPRTVAVQVQVFLQEVAARLTNAIAQRARMVFFIFICACYKPSAHRFLIYKVTGLEIVFVLSRKSGQNNLSANLFRVQK